MNSNNPLYVEALQHFQAAEHLLTVTFPLSKEPKVLWGVVASLISALESAQEIKPDHPIQLLPELKKLWELHQNSPIEFRRKEQVVVCTKEYYCEYLTEERVERYLQETKRILESLAPF